MTHPDLSSSSVHPTPRAADITLGAARFLDVAAGTWRTADIRLTGGRIVEITEPAPAGAAPAGERVDLTGRFVLPGLIDCHVHVLAVDADLSQLMDTPTSYVMFGAARLMSDMLDRGFTTVRDMAGADFGIHRAQREGLLRAPKIFFAGRALSQTGGHGDARGPGRTTDVEHRCCPSLSRIADGVDAVRLAARDELRTGAHHLKIMVSGGVASPTDRIDSTQYSLDEIRAVVEEAEAANRYVAAHAYTPRAIQRALACGVRTIEHGNLIDEETVALVKRHNAFVTMNLVTYRALADEGAGLGLPAESVAKVGAVLDGGISALRLLHAAGLNPAYGSDLLGAMQRHQAGEFAIRAEHQPTLEVIRAATTVAATVLQREGELGQIIPGAAADLVVLDEDPLQDISVLAESRLRAVVQDGVVVAGRLG
ncbi:metal-dependent hydrolase family protein [Nakamurella lactea]|uniref:metal-dependent hydrolase family protein n=1 Tax=Nakamurella lactea TaxID=459515 RepID=UPI000419F373|nr:amidohydrolase family protein [Nakamurella lactea]